MYVLEIRVNSSSIEEGRSFCFQIKRKHECMSLFTSITEYAAVDLRGLRRNAAMRSSRCIIQSVILKDPKQSSIMR